MEEIKTNRLIFHPKFNEVVMEISKLNIRLPPPIPQDYVDFSSLKGVDVEPIEKEAITSLNPKKEFNVLKDRKISAYDESKNKFAALEGTAYAVSHSLIILSEEDYVPSNFITFNFYTRSEELAKEGKSIKYCDDPEAKSNEDYHIDRNEFLSKTVPSNSILFIDGPLIGGQATSYANKLNSALLKKNTIPIFFVKNSLSNLVVSKIPNLKNKYNSDLHWANNVLKIGERTCFFNYKDAYNPNNTKLFCYIKVYENTTQRVEMHPETYNNFKSMINELMNLIYYLMLVQGDVTNPQIRPIAIAEMYARATLRTVEFTKTMEQLGITPTMNQNRGFTQ